MGGRYISLRNMWENEELADDFLYTDNVVMYNEYIIQD